MNRENNLNGLFIASTGKPNKDKIIWLSSTMFTMGDGWIREIVLPESISLKYLDDKENDKNE